MRAPYAFHDRNGALSENAKRQTRTIWQPSIRVRTKDGKPIECGTTAEGRDFHLPTCRGRTRSTDSAPQVDAIGLVDTMVSPAKPTQAVRFARDRWDTEREYRAQAMLLGLYDDDGLLHHVGFTSAIKNAEKPALTDKLAPLITDASFTGNAPGGPSRWSTKRSSEWVPVKPKLVIEVSYDHFTGGRFRHGTSILRWRLDKKPRQCGMDQLKQKTLNPATLLHRL